MPCRFCYEGNIIPVFFGKCTGGINIMTCSGSISAENIHLPYFWRNGFHILMGIRTSTSIIYTISRRIVMIWNSHIPTVGVICGGSKHISCFIKSKSPGIIRGIGHKFQFTSIGFKAKKALSKPKRILTFPYYPFKSRISY